MAAGGALLMMNRRRLETDGETGLMPAAVCSAKREIFGIGLSVISQSESTNVGQAAASIRRCEVRHRE